MSLLQPGAVNAESPEPSPPMPPDFERQTDQVEHLHKLATEFESWWTNPLLSDVQFLVGLEGQEPKLIHAHKVFLAARSPVFKTMFTTDQAGVFTKKPDEGPIRVNDVE